MIFNKKLSLFLSGITGINNIMIRKKNSKSLMQTLFKISLILLSKIGLKFNAFFFLHCLITATAAVEVCDMKSPIEY